MPTGIYDRSKIVFKSYYKDLTGQRFGRLTVLGVSHKKGNNRYRRCKCDCGNETIQRPRDVESCGCLQRERISNSARTHGMRGTGIYRSRRGMMRRCDDCNYRGYKYWGGRGIVYDNKRKIFEEFYKDMGPTRKKGLTIDRIDNDGNYCKDNCRRATRSEQNYNRRPRIK